MPYEQQRKTNLQNNDRGAILPQKSGKMMSILPDSMLKIKTREWQKILHGEPWRKILQENCSQEWVAVSLYLNYN